MARKPTDPEIDTDAIARRHRFPTMTKLGYSRLDPTPIAPPLGYKKQPSLVEQIRHMVKSEALAAAAAAAGAETFEESEDFEVDDELGVIDPHSPWENDFDPPAKEIAKAVGDHRREEAARKAYKPPGDAKPAGGGGAQPPSDGPAAQPPLDKPPSQ